MGFSFWQRCQWNSRSCQWNYQSCQWKNLKTGHFEKDANGIFTPDNAANGVLGLASGLAAGGEPSTRFPPGGLVETAGIPDYCEFPRTIRENYSALKR